MSNYGMYDLDSCHGDERETALPTIDVFEIEPEPSLIAPQWDSFLMTDAEKLLNNLRAHLNADGVELSINGLDSKSICLASVTYIFDGTPVYEREWFSAHNNSFNETFADAVFELKNKCAPHIARKEEEKNGN